MPYQTFTNILDSPPQYLGWDTTFKTILTKFQSISEKALNFNLHVTKYVLTAWWHFKLEMQCYKSASSVLAPCI